MNGNSERSAIGTQLKRRLVELTRSHLSIQVDDGQQEERSRRVTPMLEALSSNLFRLVVMGEVKKGKSSFINALLGQPELLPTAIDIATSTVYKIVYGPVERITVIFLSAEHDSPAPPPIEISRDQLKEFGTEDGNPGNAKLVDFIAIEMPHPLLAEGVVIVDTPGVGGLFKKHRDITFRYAPQADVVMFVLDSVEAVISDDEVKFLKELKKSTEQIVFLQTKIDIAGTEQVQAWKKRNLEVLANVLSVDASSIPYFLVGAKQKQRADRLHDPESLRESGYLDVLSYVREQLIPRRDEILTRRWLSVLASELLSSAKLNVDRLAITRDANQPKLVEYEKKLQKAEREYDNWQNDVWPERYRGFQDDTGRLKREMRNRLQDSLSPDSRECTSSIEELRANCGTADQVNDLADRLLATWAAKWSADGSTILEDFRRSYFQHVEKLVGQVANDLTSISLPDLSIEPAERRVDPGDQVAAIREATMNASIFGGLAREVAFHVGWGASLGVGLGLLSNPVGWAISAAATVGYLATRIWTAARGYSSAHERQRDAAVASFERALMKTGNMAQRTGLRIFDGLSADLDSATRAKVDAFRSKTKHEFTARRQEIVEARSRTVAEAKAAEEKLKATQVQYQGFAKELQEIQQSLSAGAKEE